MTFAKSHAFKWMRVEPARLSQLCVASAVTHDQNES